MISGMVFVSRAPPANPHALPTVIGDERYIPNANRYHGPARSGGLVRHGSLLESLGWKG
jgi:hypothetical protein